MKKEHNILVFESEAELDDFQGIFVEVHPNDFGYGEIFEKHSNGRQRPIGLIDIAGYYPCIPTIEEATTFFKDTVVKIVNENYPSALQLGIPEIAISKKLEIAMFSEYKEKILKYIGILKKITETFVGVEVELLTKFSDDKSYIEEWQNLYPNSDALIIENNEVLQEFFIDFEDITPVTEEEKKEAKRLYEEIMKDM